MNKYGIGFFTTAVLAVLILTFAYQFSFQKAREHAQEEAEVKRETQTVPADANKKEGYYLIEEGGFLVVYASDRKTVYEYTIATNRLSKSSVFSKILRSSSTNDMTIARFLYTLCSIISSGLFLSSTGDNINTTNDVSVNIT